MINYKWNMLSHKFALRCGRHTWRLYVPELWEGLVLHEYQYPQSRRFAHQSWYMESCLRHPKRESTFPTFPPPKQFEFHRGTISPQIRVCKISEKKKRSTFGTCHILCNNSTRSSVFALYNSALQLNMSISRRKKSFPNKKGSLRKRAKKLSQHEIQTCLFFKINICTYLLYLKK